MTRRYSTNDHIKEAGLSDITNIDISVALSLLRRGGIVCSVGQSRLASRAAVGDRRIGVTLSRYIIRERSGNFWPVEIGRARDDGESGPSMPPLGSARLPISKVENFADDMAMKLDAGERALILGARLERIAVAYGALGWRASHEAVSIHFEIGAPKIADLILLRREK